MEKKILSYLNSNLFQLFVSGKNRIAFYALLMLCPLFLYNSLMGQDLDVPYVSTPPAVVEKMLDVADVGPGDYVIDLGCGDGRIVIAAAQRGAFGHGIDLDPQRIREAKENARLANVEDRVMFLQEDLFETDFSHANVITMYLLGSINIRLRPTLLRELEPGTKIVSHSFDMGAWKPDKTIRIEDRDLYGDIHPRNLFSYQGDQGNGLPNRGKKTFNLEDTSGFDLSAWMVNNSLLPEKGTIKLESLESEDPKGIFTHTIFYWIVPTQIEGQWTWHTNGKNFKMTVKQHFQEIKLDIQTGNTRLNIGDSLLKGERIAFTAVDQSKGIRYVYNGRVDEGRIEGKVQIRRAEAQTLENWSAELK